MLAARLSKPVDAAVLEYDQSRLLYIRLLLRMDGWMDGPVLSSMPSSIRSASSLVDLHKSSRSRLARWVFEELYHVLGCIVVFLSELD